MCLNCGGPLLGRKAKFALKYFRTEGGQETQHLVLAAFTEFPEVRAAFCTSREEFYLRQIPFGMDGPSLAGHVLAMGQIDGLTCRKCGAKLIATPSPSTNGLRALRCPDCDCLDPLKSERAMGWLKSELRPPKR